jgi:hypothetical protein
MAEYVNPYTLKEQELMAKNSFWIEKNLRLQSLLKRAIKENTRLRTSLKGQQDLARGVKTFDTGHALTYYGGSMQSNPDGTFTSTTYGKRVLREDYNKLLEGLE